MPCHLGWTFPSDSRIAMWENMQQGLHGNWLRDFWRFFLHFLFYFFIVTLARTNFYIPDRSWTIPSISESLLKYKYMHLWYQWQTLWNRAALTQGEPLGKWHLLLVLIIEGLRICVLSYWDQIKRKYSCRVIWIDSITNCIMNINVRLQQLN